MADILIRGMEMPTRCGLCPMFCDDFNDYCSAAQRSIPFDAEKPEWCPLLPLPEGHGRLADLDAPIRIACHDGTIRETTPSRLLCEHSLLDLPKTIVPKEGGGEMA